MCCWFFFSFGSSAVYFTGRLISYALYSERYLKLFLFFSEHAKETLGTNHVMNYSVFLESTDGNQNNDQPNDKYTFVS